METETKLKEIFADIFNTHKEKISLKTRQNELKDWDSLGQLRLMMAIEERFNISFTIEEIASLNSFERILSKISQKTGK